MIIVADTSPINYLVLIGHTAILEALFQRVVIPHAVYRELTSTLAPNAVRAWIAAPPPWLGVGQPIEIPDRIDPELGNGEREAIALVLDNPAAILIIDEMMGRHEALRHGINIVGTLGILARAHDAGLLDLRTAIAQLQRSNFFISQELIEASLRNRY